LSPPYRVVLAREGDLGALPTIELAASALLAGHAPPEVLRKTTGDDELRAACEDGRLWVALADDVPVGFALVGLLPSGQPHLEELGVHPDHGRRGLGAALVRAACEWASRSGHTELSLTTFRAVPWNQPFYARLGFEEVPRTELRRELVEIVREEAQRGLDPERRVVMRYRAQEDG
jgi:GNAT superfamily N-acetyltransferase